MTLERIWCTLCDRDYEYSGIALDYPKDGKYYTCPKCKHRIVVFENPNLTKAIDTLLKHYEGK